MTFCVAGGVRSSDDRERVADPSLDPVTVAVIECAAPDDDFPAPRRQPAERASLNGPAHARGEGRRLPERPHPRPPLPPGPPPRRERGAPDRAPRALPGRVGARGGAGDPPRRPDDRLRLAAPAAPPGREALQQAVRWQLLARNPADAVEPPRAQRREMEAFDQGEVERLLEAARGTRLAVPVLLAVTTGLRRGELLGLRWQDVDLDVGKLAVRLEQTKAGLAFKQPKTHKGRRVVTLPRMTVDALRRHRAEQAREKLLLGPAYQDNGLVLARVDGRPLDPAGTTRAFARLVRRAGVRPISLHALRHTHATLLLGANVHPKVVSERLGHATVGITLTRTRTSCRTSKRKRRGRSMACSRAAAQLADGSPTEQCKLCRSRDWRRWGRDGETAA